MSKSLSIIGRGISALALTVSGLALFTGTAGAVGTPGAPTGVGIKATAAGAVTVSWTNPASTTDPITSYNITVGSTPVVVATSTALGAAGAANSYTWTPTSALGTGAVHVVSVSADGGTAADAGALTLALPGASTTKPTALPGNGTLTVTVKQLAADYKNFTNASTSADTVLPATSANIYNAATDALVCSTTTLGAYSSSAYADSTCVVNDATAGLSVGTGASYSFYVKFVNPAGTGAKSTQNSDGAIAASAPSAPTGFTATLNNATATVNFSWTAPSSTGGSSLTYAITKANGEAVTTVPAADSITGTTATALLSGISGSAPYTGAYILTATNGQSLTSTATSNALTAGVVPPQVVGVTIGDSTSASAITSATATVHWTPAASSGQTEVTGYSVQLYTCTTATSTTCVVSGSPKIVSGGGAASTTFAVTPGSYYSATVTAIDGAGSGVPSALATPQTYANTAPGTPVVTVSAKTNSSVTFGWTSAANGAAVSATSVQLYTSTTSNGTKAATSTAAAANATITFTGTGLVNSVNDVLWLYNSTGGFIAKCTVTSASVTAPVCSGGPSATVTTNVAATTVASVAVMVTSGSAVVAGTATSYTFSNLSGAFYAATVTTTNSVGTSSVGYATTLPAVNVAPTAVTIGYTSTSAITISWTAAASTTVATSTVIDATTGLTVCTATGTATSCTITATQAAAASGHAFKVYTTDAAGVPTGLSAASTATLAAPGAVTPTGAPTAYGAPAGIYVTWTAASSTNSYNIVGYPSDGSSPVTATSTTAYYLFPASALKTGITYLFQVKANSAVGSSTYSANSTGSPSAAQGLATHTATDALPVAPTVATAAAVANSNGNAVTFTWGAGGAGSSGAPLTGYIGTLTQANGNTMTCTVPAGTLSCTFTGVPPAGSTVATSSVWLSFVSVATNAFGNSVTSTKLDVTAGQDHGVAGPVTGVTATADSNGKGITVTWVAPTVNASYWSGYQITFTNTTARSTQVPFLCYSHPGLGSKNVVGADLLTFDCTNTTVHNATGANGEPTPFGTTTPTTAFIPGNSYSVTVAAISITLDTTSVASLNGAVTATTVGNSGNTGLLGSNQTGSATTTTTVLGSSVGNGSATATILDVPGAPTGVTAAIAGSNKVTVSWTAPASNGGSAITGYIVTAASTDTMATTTACTSGGVTTNLTNTTNANTVITVASALITTITCTFGGTAAATTFTVQAVNGTTLTTNTTAGYSAASAASTAVTPVAYLAAPTVYTSGAVGSAITVSWTAVTGATSYTVAFTAISPTGSVTTTTTTGVTNTYLVVPATATGADDTYSVTVATANTAGTGTASGAVGTASGASASAALVPSAPATLVNYAGGTSAAPTTTKLVWTAPTNTYGLPVTYNVVATVAGVITTLASGLSVTTWSETYSATHTAITVYAVNTVGVSASGTVIGTTYAAVVPGAPTGLSGGTPSATGATVTWTSGATAGTTGFTAPVTTGYTITATGSNGTSATCTWASGTTCTFALLSGNVTYTYSIVETNANGSSVAATGTFTTAVGAPGAPTVTSVTATDTTATLTWTAPALTGGAPIGSYLVSATSAGGSPMTCTTTTALTCTVTGLTAGTAATYAVTAYNAIGAGTPATTSNSVAGFTTLAAAAAPVGVKIITTGAKKPSYPAIGSMTINWTVGAANATPVTGFICEAVDASGVNATVDVSVGATATTCSFTGLANVAYTVHVYALNATATTVATGTIDGAVITNVALTTNVVTITTASKHAYYVGETVNVTAGTTTSVNGAFTVKAVTDNTFTYALTATNISTTADTGTVSSGFTSNTWVNDAPALFGGASAVSGTISIQGIAPIQNLANGGLAVGSTNDNVAPTSYTVKAYTAAGVLGGTKSCTTLATPCTVVGLVAGATYNVSVIAVNAIGTSNVYQTSAFTVLSATAPAAPTAVTALRTTNGLSVGWTAPASAGSGQLVGYLVSATDALTGQQYTCPYNATYGVLLAPSVSCYIAGLTVGNSYTVSVTAITQDGAGTVQRSAAATKTVEYNSLSPEPVMATFLAVTAKQKSVSALSGAAKSALNNLISITNDGAKVTVTGYGTTMAIALARANATATYLQSNGAAVHVSIKTVISKTIKTALVTVTSN